jgi:hypothetical protein
VLSKRAGFSISELKKLLDLIAVMYPETPVVEGKISIFCNEPVLLAKCHKII